MTANQAANRTLQQNTARRSDKRSVGCMVAPIYRFSISFRRSSFDLPSFCWSRPSSSSSLPLVNARSSSVNCPYFCFSLPFASFQLPLNCNFVIAINVSPAKQRLVASTLKRNARAASFQCELFPGTENTMKIPYAVVVLGHIAQTAVLPAFEHAENSELAALITGNPEKDRELSDRYGVNAYTYDDLEDALKKERVDAVYIAKI